VDRDEGTRGVLGDILALVSAVFYGAYCSLLKYKIKDENQVNMPMFFGYVGIFNMVVMLPGLIILHFTGIEPFEAPSLQIVLYLTANGLIGTVVSGLVAWLS
jgi:solute carrier family 35 protein F5